VAFKGFYSLYIRNIGTKAFIIDTALAEQQKYFSNSEAYINHCGDYKRITLRMGLRVYLKYRQDLHEESGHDGDDLNRCS
jgi:hypothetical protein